MRLFLFLPITLFVILGCRSDHNPQHDMTLRNDSIKNVEYPIVIDGGKRIIYQFSKMTPRGPVYFLDTVDNNAASLNIDSLNPNFLFPLSLSDDERNHARGIIAISLPGYFEETVFGVLDSDNRLRMRYKNREVYLQANEEIRYNKPIFKSSFKHDSLEVVVDAALKETVTGTHFAGAGVLTVRENESLTRQHHVFVVCKKDL